MLLLPRKKRKENADGFLVLSVEVVLLIEGVCAAGAGAAAAGAAVGGGGGGMTPPADLGGVRCDTSAFGVSLVFSLLQSHDQGDDFLETGNRAPLVGLVCFCFCSEDTEDC